jgi:hypothetical protein
MFIDWLIYYYNICLANQEIVAYYESRMFTVVCIKVRRWFVLWTKCILLTPACTLSIKLFPLCLCGPTRATAFTFLRFLDHTQRRRTVGRAPLDEWSACRKRPLPEKHNTHNRQTSTPPAGFELWISGGERQQTDVLDRAVAGTGVF